MLKKHALIEMFVIFPTTCIIMFSSAYELKPRLNSQILDYIFGLMKHNYACHYLMGPIYRTVSETELFLKNPNFYKECVSLLSFLPQAISQFLIAAICFVIG